MTGERWNLLAAILCTISAGLVTIAALLSELNLVGVFTLIAGDIGTLVALHGSKRRLMG